VNFQQRKAAIATLLKQGKPDLANQMSHRTTAAPPKLGKALEKAIKLTREFRNSADNDAFKLPTDGPTSKGVDKMGQQIRTLLTAIIAASKHTDNVANQIMTSSHADEDLSLERDLGDLSDAWYDVTLAATMARRG
jgi:hypothetical protein